MVKTEIITIGDEILIGQIVDTNSAWLGDRLSKLGLYLRQITSIGDKKGEILSALDRAISENELTIVTGGLGPTKDDITKHTLAELFSCKLVRNEECYMAVEELCRKKGVDFNELNKGQADIPECCTVIINDHGTAAGMIFERNGHYLISLPGVPFEMKPIFEDKVTPFLKMILPLSHNVHISATIYGLAESALAMEIEEWENELPSQLHLAYLPNPSRIRLRLSAYGVDNPEEIEELIFNKFEELKLIIPKNFIGDEDQSVESSVADLLTKRGETLSIAESCTGGAIAAQFTAMAGASKYFLGGIVAYSNDMKVNALGVNRHNIEQHGAVSEIVVGEMAEGIRKLTNSTYSIATSGVAGPESDDSKKAVGTVCMAISTPNGTFTTTKIFTKLREQNIEYSKTRAISLLRNILIEL